MIKIEQLWEEYTIGFPDEEARKLKLIRVPKLLPGTAAFPVSTGLIREKGCKQIPLLPVNGVMFIGNDPDSVKNYNNRLSIGISNGDEPKRMGYWKGVYRLLDEMARRGAALHRSECFFTNVYAALREGTKNAGGSRPKSEFLKWCLRFLGAQVSTVEPRLIVAFRGETCKSIGLRPDQILNLRLSDTVLAKHTNAKYQDVPIACLWHPSRRPYPGYASQADLLKLNADCLARAL